MNSGTYWGQSPSRDGIRRRRGRGCQPGSQRNRRSTLRKARSREAPPAGFEPALTAPEANSIFLRYLRQHPLPSLARTRFGRGTSSAAHIGHLP